MKNHNLRKSRISACPGVPNFAFRNLSLSLRKYLLTIFLLLLIPLWATAQTIEIKGNVKDRKGEALIGVSILEVGSKTNGTITDTEGKFSLRVPKDARLIFSYVGFMKTTVNVDGRSIVDVVLDEESKSLGEVVVVGYGKMKRADLTGSIATVSSEAINKSVVTSVDQILQGRAAGVQVQQNTGMPGGSTSIRIRGVNSINGSNEPIFVIDGVIIDGSSGSSDSNPIASINPADIASIDILKDASATAIYGSRASNGVIMINTKRGKSGDAKITYNGYAGWQEMPKKLDLLDLREYATLKNARAAAGIVQADSRFVRPDLLGKGTDWQNELFSKAYMTNHNLTISGGSEKSTFIIGAGYLNQDGIAAGSGFKRYNLRGNVDSQLKKWLKAGVEFNISNSNQKLTVSDASLIKIAMKQTPDVAARNADGSFDGPQTTEYVQSNPLGLALIKENYREKTGMRGNTYLDVTFFKGLSYKTEFSFDYGIDNAYKFNPSYTFGAIENTTIESERSKSYNKFWSFRNILTYNNTFNKLHTLNLMLGQEAQKSGWEYLDGYRSGFISNSAHDLNLGDATTAKNSGSSSYSSLSSYFGRLFYSFNDRYLLTATLRRDGSSKFAEEHRWGWFPSAALAWKVSNEPFLKDNPFIYNLKLRLGWGQTGNQNLPDNYAYTSTLSSVQTATWGVGMLVGNTANPELTWETSTSSNVGVDFSILKGRIDLTCDLYYKKTKNLLLQLPLPSYVGTTGVGASTPPWANVGSLRNEGIELSLNTINVERKNFTWKTTVVFSMNRNRVLAMNTQTGIVNGTISEGSETNNVVTRTAVGHSIGEFYGYKIIGRFEKATDFYYRDKNGNLKNTALPNGISIGQSGAWVGDYIFADLNNDGKIDDSDRTYIGNPEPKFTYGITNGFSYKNFDLSVALNGVYGSKIVNYQRRWLENPAASTNLLHKAMNYAVLSKIDPNGPVDYRNQYISGGDGDMCRLSNGSYQTWNYAFSDKFVEDGTYLRIQSISLGYNLPKSLLKVVGIESMRVYANLQNVYTFTVYSGYDPEIGSMNQNALLTGIDNARYPSPRIFTFGLNVSF